MAATKRKPGQIIQDRAQISELFAQGYTYREIARQMKMPLSMIQYDLEELQRQWLEEASLNISQAKANHLRKLRKLLTTAYKMFEESQGIIERRTAQMNDAGTDGGKNSRSTIVQEKSAGDASALGIVMRALEQEAKVMGLTKIEVEHTGDPSGGVIPSVLAAYENALERIYGQQPADSPVPGAGTKQG